MVSSSRLRPTSHLLRQPGRRSSTTWHIRGTWDPTQVPLITTDLRKGDAECLGQLYLCEACAYAGLLQTDAELSQWVRHQDHPAIAASRVRDYCRVAAPAATPSW